jgi:hypothetical protein
MGIVGDRMNKPATSMMNDAIVTSLTHIAGI